MIGFIIIGHNHFASGILSAVEMIIGRQVNVETVDFLPQDDIETLDKKISNSIKTLDNSDGIIFFADIAGGSPFNRSMVFLVENLELDIHVIGGINLPLLIEAFNLRNSIRIPNELIDKLISIGSESIVYGNKMLQEEFKKNIRGYIP
ncbi:PTS sugar transporter subunit IIA [Caldanaerobacter subterraneus]|uniref:PTS sugar transporter subunit IIA n=1 Tax=Caldanaerobacter subterraneus TaxID=911092 RepID=A0A7Y2PM93_9THEO|nr:PTS sugar transporter subunit IIA [Caldanaerobacter subterraneus]NNG66863.1 PTS sugar transporter subunit IIA [Caldanaerobacter subterraneus]